MDSSAPVIISRVLHSDHRVHHPRVFPRADRRANGRRHGPAHGADTLNPLAHLDPIGSLLLILAGFGWAKPVQINPYNLRNEPHMGMAIVAAAGPISNFLMALIAAIPFRLGLLSPFTGGGGPILPSPSSFCWTSSRSTCC